MLRSLRTKIETSVTTYKQTLLGVALTIGIGIGVSLLLTYIETGSLIQAAEAMKKPEGWK